MGKTRNYIIISSVLVAFLVGTLISGPQANAASPVLTFLENIVMPKLNEIFGITQSTQTQIDDIELRLSSIETQLDEIQAAVSGPAPVDNDGDGSFSDVDCDDNDANNFPGNTEIADGVDNDCDGHIDEDLVPLPSSLVINEIDYDQPGPDNDEFIEIYNVAIFDVVLSDYTLELINGADSSLYKVIPLVGDLKSGEYYVVGSPNVLDADQTLAIFSFIQNAGATGDCIQLVHNSFGVADSICYEADVFGFGEGTHAIGDSGIGDGSIGRDSFSLDTDDNSADFFFSPIITPGSANIIP